MERRTCRHCQATAIPLNAITCPHCGGEDWTGTLTRAWYSSWHGVWVGALVGGAVGCLSRPAVVAAFWLSGAPVTDGNVFYIVLPSCMIGALIGLCSGALGGLIPVPIVGGIVGAVVGGSLAFVSAFFTVFLLCIATWDAGGPGHPRNVEGGAAWYLTLMTLTGLVPGALGGLVGDLLRRRRVLAAIKTANQNREETQGN